MSFVNTVLGVLFNTLLYPFRELHPMVGLTAISGLAAVLMLLGYKATSNQPAVEAVKRKIAANLFEIRLFNDDIVAILRAQGAIMRHNAKYIGLNLIPMLFMLGPFVLLVAQLQFHYGYEGLRPGETTTLRVTLSEAAAGPSPEATVEFPDGLRLDSARVWVPSLREAAWRLVAVEAGDYELNVLVDGESFTKSVVVSEAIQQRAPARLEAGWWNQLIYPAEAPLPRGAAVTEIRVDYADRAVGVFGFEGHWLIAFFVLSVGIAFALKGRFGVTI